MQSIAEHCTGLQSLSIIDCREISDAGLMNIYELFKLHYCVQLIDTSIISISTHCTGLQSLNLGRCHQITDASIPSILTLECCAATSDASFIVIAMDLVVTSYVVMNSSL